MISSKNPTLHKSAIWSQSIFLCSCMSDIITPNLLEPGFTKKKEQLLGRQTLAYLIGNLRTELHDHGLKAAKQIP